MNMCTWLKLDLWVSQTCKLRVQKRDADGYSHNHHRLMKYAPFAYLSVKESFCSDLKMFTWHFNCHYVTRADCSCFLFTNKFS